MLNEHWAQSTITWEKCHIVQTHELRPCIYSLLSRPTTYYSPQDHYHCHSAWGRLIQHLLHISRQPHPHHLVGAGWIPCTIPTERQCDPISSWSPAVGLHTREHFLCANDIKGYLPRPQWAIHLCWLQLTQREKQDKPCHHHCECARYVRAWVTACPYSYLQSKTLLSTCEF